MSGLKQLSPLSQAGVWALRLTVGAVFVLSGFAKADDLWGFVFKIEEYLQVWGIVQPRSLVIAAAMFIASFEFIAGVMLAAGCYRRTVVWLLTLMMGVMLPLTAYIWAADPVSDCGCFGEMLRLSNAATFFKNVALMAALVVLLIYNRRVGCLFGPYIQWLVLLVVSVYVSVVAFIGYTVQPMVDFRPFPVGTDLGGLLAEEDEAVAEFEFVYEKDGVRHAYDIGSLPDSTWTFVERRVVAGKVDNRPELVVTDHDEDVSAYVVEPEGGTLLVVIPEYDRADVSFTYLVNELADRVKNSGGSVVAIIGAGGRQAAEWTDLSMADYPVYSADPTQLKELVRGAISLVWLRDGVIQWKRTAASIDADYVEASAADDAVLDSLALEGAARLWQITLVVLAVLAVLFMLDRSGRLLKCRRQLRRQA